MYTQREEKIKKWVDFINLKHVLYTQRLNRNKSNK